MNYTKILCELDNQPKIVYLDSSSLIRNYPIDILSKTLTRKNYISNPEKFSTILNYFVSPLYDITFSLYNICDKITKYTNKINIITYDCLFPINNNKQFFTLFGSFNFIGNIASLNNSIILYGDKISVETFYNISTLIRSANLIILDDYFLSLSIGKELFNHKKENTTIITLSSIIGYSTYKTKEVIDIFNYLYSNYPS